MPLFRSDVKVPPFALLKRFALTYLLVVVVFSAGGWLTLRFEELRRIQRAEDSEMSRIDVARALIVQDFSAVTSDLRLLANLPLLKRYTNERYPSQLAELSHYFLVLAEGGRRYDRVRYVDLHGHEVIRIDYDNRHAVIVPRRRLQKLSAFGPFRETIKLGAGGVYVSPFDLNVEHDRLEIPYKPIIQFGTPVFDNAGRKKGAILLSFLGNNLLDHFHDAMGGSNHHESMLLNQDGYWLSSDRHEDEWGFMLGRPDVSFAHNFAHEWPAISGNERGVLHTDRGLFVYDTVHHLQGRSATGGARPAVPGQPGGDYYWKVVSYVPTTLLEGNFLYNDPAGHKLLQGIYASLALMSALIAYTMLVRQQADTLVRDSEARLREMTGTMSDGLVVMDPRGRISFANPEACRLLGYTAEELVGANQHDLVHVRADGRPCPREECEILRVASTRVASRALEQIFRRKDGMLIPVSVSAAAIVRKRQTTGIVVAFHDITKLKQAEQALRKSAEEIEDLYEHAPCGYHSLDENGLVVRMNHTELDWLGYSRDDVVGKMHLGDLCTPESLKGFEEQFPQLRKAGFVHDLEFGMVRKDGSMFPALVNATAIYDAEGRFVMTRSTLFDLSERKKLEKELEYQARTDALTGLNNRRYFLELAKLELERSRRYKEPLALLMLDVDHFKRFNDTYGHHIGDEVLKKVSEACARTLREIDIVGRLGGEEFAVMLPETDLEQALDAAERLRAAVASLSVPVESGTASFTVSIGVTRHVPADRDVETMLRRADAALYVAKNAGRNCVQVSLPEPPTG